MTSIFANRAVRPTILLYALIITLCISGRASAGPVEDEIRALAHQEYPDDARMQTYVYKKQLAAYRYLLSVQDQEVKQIALREYPSDYAMQKYVYDKQLAAKQYMTSQPDSSARSRARREHPRDYAMQKYVYDKILSAAH